MTGANDQPYVRSDSADVASTAVDAKRAKREARRADPDWSFDRLLGLIDRSARAIAEHTIDGYGGLAELHAIVDVHRRLGDVIDTMARHLLEHDDASYREIGLVLGIGRTAVEKRYPGASSRPAGGQPGNLR
jgi:hypothetical protein